MRVRMYFQAIMIGLSLLLKFGACDNSKSTPSEEPYQPATDLYTLPPDDSHEPLAKPLGYPS